MPWYFPWSDSIKKRACRYLLQRYLGHFLQEKLTLEQLTVDLYNGTGKVENVALDIWSVNEMLDSVCSPLEIVDGYIGSISVSVPWTALLNDSCCLDIQGLELTLAPKRKSTDTGVSMMDSVIWNSMTTSMELAQECLKQSPSSGEEQAETSQTFEGLESFAQTIESVLSRIKLSFSDTIVRLEHLSQETRTGIGVEIHIKRIEYCDFSSELSDNNSQFKAKSVYEPAAFACKNLKIMGVTCHVEEFPEQERTAGHAYSPHLSPASSTGSPAHSSHGLDRISAENFADKACQPGVLLPCIKIATFAGQSEVKLKVKQNMAVPGPKVDLECFLGTLNVFLSPNQVHLLLEVANGLTAQDLNQKPEMKGRSASKPMQLEDYQRIEQDLHNQLQQAKRRDSQHKVHLWDANFESDEFSHPSSSTEYDSVLGDDEDGDGGEKFYSMCAHDILPPLEEPQLPVDMVTGSAALPSHGLPGLVAGSFLPAGSLANIRLGSAKVPVPGTSLTEAAGSVFVSAHQSLSPTGKAPTSRPRTLSSTNPGLAGIAALDDPSSDAIRLSLRLSSAALTVLHVDPVLSPASSVTEPSPDEISGDSNHPMARMAENFFASLGTFGFGSKDFDDMKERFAEACRPADHLRCVCAPLSVEVERTSTSSHQTVNCDLSVGKLELLECLFERPSTSTTHPAPCSFTKLLTFIPEDHATLHNFTSNVSSYSACLKAKYRNIQRTLSPGGVQSRNTIVPKSELCLEMGPLFSELDLSIVDRIGGLLSSQVSGHTRQGSPGHARMFRSVNPSAVNQQALFTAAIDDGPSADIPLSVRASCPSLTVALRFPIPDLRPEIDRRPWWKQSLRDEMLLLDFSSVELKTTLFGSEPPKEYDLQFKQLEGHLKRSQYGDLIPLLCVNSGQVESENGNKGFDWPRIVVSTKPAAPLSALEEMQSAENSPLSSLDAYPVMKSEPSPFSSKPVMFDTEQLVIPGSQEEMSKFQEDTTSACRVHVQCTFPSVDVNLHTKEVFELIYNRLASDLLLWEPAAPCPVERPDIYATSIGGLDLASQLLEAQGPDRFVMCRSGVRVDDDSSSSDESEFDSLEHKQRKSAHELNGQTLVAFTLNIGKGRLALFPKTQGPASNLSPGSKDSGEDLGEVIVELDDVTFFLAACYRGRADLSYLCLQSGKASVLHAPHAQRDAHLTLESAFCGAELQSTLYPSEPGVRRGLGESEDPMLALAMKVSMDTDKNVKEILFSLGLRDATMRHRIVPAGQLWLNQVMDFMDVKDDPVLGFVPPAVVTVFHTHVWGGLIDYRPIHLPLRALLALESFSVSSNITVESSVSVLRFIIDDAALYLSNKCSGMANIKSYVCVMDMGMFELSLFTSDGRDKHHPKVELRMSSDTLHIRTCSDSFSALLQLIQYIAADGDLVPSYEPDDPKAATPGTPSRCAAESPVKQVSLRDNEMSCIMSEAMADSPETDDSDSDAKEPRGDLNRQQSKSPKRDLFLFPGDQPLDVEDAGSSFYDDAIEPAAGPEGEEEGDGESDDEFCILEHPDKEPEGLTDQVLIRCFAQDEIQLVENHFAVPLGRSDQLRAPDHFPGAVFRYTLREMSIVWQMFGGQDLNSTSQQSNTPKKVTFADESRRSPKAEERSSRSRLPPSDKMRGTGAGLRKGGPGRNDDELMELHVNKIRFQHDTYPEDTEQASRMVFMAQEVEMRDRLANSQINKFLYQYTSESMPKQTHANMVLIKMLYVRPEAHLTGQEGCLRVSIQPLRLNVDQDALFFLKSFFSEVAEEASKNPKGSNTVESSPVKTVAAPSFPDEKLLCDLRDAAEEPCLVSDMSEPVDEEPADAQAPSFFRSFVFSPEVPIRLDYQGKHVDMDQGTLAGLLIGLAQLNCSELRLKRLCCRSGLLGIDKVISYALAEWLNDIRRTQLPGILGGVGPVHSFVQLFQGLVDLVRLPIDQYRKDGRVMLGLQRGANAFTTSSAMAFLELANRGVHLVQAAAETAYDMVNPGRSMSPNKRGQHRLAHQPADLREGVSNAYQVVTQGLGRAATNIVQVAKEEHEQKGVTGAVGGVLRQVPATMVQPLILATEATSNVLGGVRNQILPDARREATEKWKTSPQ